MLSLLGGVYSYLSGLCEKRYESSCKKLLAECISAVLAGFIGMCFAEYKGMDESLQNCVILIFSVNSRSVLEDYKSLLKWLVFYAA
ncbi:phage holin family protein [Escherichia coli]